MVTLVSSVIVNVLLVASHWKSTSGGLEFLGSSMPSDSRGPDTHLRKLANFMSYAPYYLVTPTTGCVAVEFGMDDYLMVSELSCNSFRCPSCVVFLGGDSAATIDNCSSAFMSNTVRVGDAPGLETAIMGWSFINLGLRSVRVRVNPDVPKLPTSLAGLLCRRSLYSQPEILTDCAGRQALTLSFGFTLILGPPAGSEQHIFWYEQAPILIALKRSTTPETLVLENNFQSFSIPSAFTEFNSERFLVQVSEDGFIDIWRNEVFLMSFSSSSQTWDPNVFATVYTGRDNVNSLPDYDGALEDFYVFDGMISPGNASPASNDHIIPYLTSATAYCTATSENRLIWDGPRLNPR